MASIYPIAESRTGKRAWRVQYQDERGARRQKQFKTKREANTFVENIGTKRSDGDLTPKSKTPFSEFADTWLRDCESGRDGQLPLEKHTLRVYRGHVINYLNPRIGKTSLGKITEEDCEELRDQLITAAPSRKTARKILTTFKSILLYAAKKKHFKHSPAQGLKIVVESGRHRVQPQDQIRIHSKKEMKSVLALAMEWKRTRTVWLRYCPALHMLIYCGLRSSELRGLPRDAVDTHLLTVEVKQRADETGTIGPPKTAHAFRTIHMPPIVGEVVDEYLRTHNYDLVFPTSEGTAMLHQNLVRRMWDPIQKSSNVRRLNFHATRHFFASLMIAKGCTLKNLTESMGHHDPAFTLKTYGHLFEDDADARREFAKSLQL